MFKYSVPAFPDDKLLPGRYLEPTTVPGLAVIAKILKSNEQTVCRSTLQHLTDEEIHCSIHQDMLRVFTESDSQALGPAVTEQDLPAEDLTPEYLTYDDDHDPDPGYGDLEVAPEIGYN
jgi:hypothetical protein